MFEPPSDEEIEHDEPESESEVEDDGEVAEESDHDGEKEKVRKTKKSQSPWDFSNYTESLADEHSRQGTTSIDYKISKALERRPIATAEDSEENSDAEPHQVMIFLFLMLNE